MSVTVKIFGLVDYGQKPKLTANLKQFFQEELQTPAYDTNILFVTCDSQVTGSPVLAEVSVSRKIGMDFAADSDFIERLLQVFYPVTNTRISLGFLVYAGFITIDNPERQCKFHSNELAFADWRNKAEA